MGKRKAYILNMCTRRWSRSSSLSSSSLCSFSRLSASADQKNLQARLLWPVAISLSIKSVHRSSICWMCLCSVGMAFCHRRSSWSSSSIRDNRSTWRGAFRSVPKCLTSLVTTGMAPTMTPITSKPDIFPENSTLRCEPGLFRGRSSPNRVSNFERPNGERA